MTAPFEKKLNDLRKSKGFSQEELAKVVGIHTNLLGLSELEETKSSNDIVASLSDRLGVSLDYFVEKTDTKLNIATLDKIVTIQKPHEEDSHCTYMSSMGLCSMLRTN